MAATRRSRAQAVPVPGETGPLGPELETRNEVVLVGRVGAAAEERALPSGDLIVTWRLVVDRPAGGRPLPPGVRPSTVDTLDCVAWTPGTRRRARGLQALDVVRVEGALRRRFWRGAGGGPVSRCEVEVTAVQRLSRPSGSRPRVGHPAAARPTSAEPVVVEPVVVERAVEHPSREESPG